MDAALHGGDGNVPSKTDDELPGVADGRRAGEVGNFLVRNLRGGGEFISKRAEAGAEDKRNFRAELRTRKDEVSGSIRAHIFECGRFLRAHDHRSITPTMEADIRLAIVPHSMARMPSCARSERLLGASAP